MLGIVKLWSCDTICTPDIELLSVYHRPFYLPRNLLTVLIVVGIYPKENATSARNVMADVTHTLNCFTTYANIYSERFQQL